MSRCCICNYSDYGLSDIPLDDRTIANDVCSKCSKEIHPPKVSENSGTIGWMLSSDDTFSDDLDRDGGCDLGISLSLDDGSDMDSPVPDSTWNVVHSSRSHFGYGIDPGSDVGMALEAPNLTAEWGLVEGPQNDQGREMRNF